MSWILCECVGVIQRSKNHYGGIHHPLEHVPVSESILKYLDVQDLLQCSLVCKAWSKQARIVLQTHKKCLACIRLNENLSHEISKLSTVISNMSYIPYNGIRILYPHFWGQDNQIEITIPPNIFSPRFTIKYLYIHGVCLTSECQALRFAMKIISEQHDSLQELRFFGIERCNVGSTEVRNEPSLVGPGCLSNLKLLELNCNLSQLNWLMKLDQPPIRKLLSEAQNLKEQRVVVQISASEHIPQSALAIVNNLELALDSSMDVTELRAFLTFSDKRQVSRSPYRMVHLFRFWDHFRRILQDSSTTIKSLRLDSLTAVVLVRCGVNCLPNVTKLTIGINTQVLRGPLGVALRSIDLPSIFPQVEQVKFIRETFQELDGYFQSVVKWMERWLQQFGEAVDFFRNRQVEHKINAISQLTLVCDGAGEDTADYLRTVWSFRPYVQNLEIQFSAETSKNLDGLFIGIEPQESALLRDKSPEFLKALHIVPLHPSLSNCSGLRKLVFRCHRDASTLRGIISEAAFYLVFQRIPGCQVVVLDV